MTRASIIVVSWNGEAYLGECLDSLWTEVGPDDEVIVVDNASTDGSVGLVRQRYPQVRLIQNDRNLGFAGGMNVGLRAAHGDLLLSVNQDVEVHQGWVEALLETLARPGVGIAGCKLFYPDGAIQHAGGIVHWPRAVVDHHGYRRPDDGQWDRLRPVDYVTGAAWGFRRAVVEQIGLLDEGYWPGYYEEVDYCFRARRAGWQVVYTPAATGVHHESVSLGKSSVTYQRAFNRGRLRFVVKSYAVGQVEDAWLASEREYVRSVDIGFARHVLSPVYLDTLLHLPDLSSEMSWARLRPRVSETTRGLSDLYLLALHSIGGDQVDDHIQPMQLPTDVSFPPLQEHDFQSDVPVIGPLIRAVRHLVYGVSARWGVLAVIHQQNRINQLIAQHNQRVAQYVTRLAQRMDELDARLVDQDRDLAHLARVVAEVEIRQRYIGKMVASTAPPDQETASTGAVET